MSRFKHSATAAAVACALSVPFAAHATNGYFQHGYGTKSGGMAGAGVALPQDSLIAATNPAGMVHVGERIDVGVSLFSPMREYEASSASAATGFFTVGPNTDPTFANTGTVAAQSKESENEAFLVPQFGWNKMLTPDSSIGVSVYGNGGMNTQYDGGFGTFNFTFFGFPPGPGSAPSFPGTFGGGQPGTPGGSTAGVDLSQLFVAPTYSRKFAGGKASWGVSAILAYQLFEARGLGAFAPFSTNPNKLTDNNHDSSFGAGARLGIMAELSPQLTVGASYQTPIWMDEFGEYEGLFAEQGGFDIPQNATLGLAWRPRSGHVLAADVQWIDYSSIDSVGRGFNEDNAFNRCFGHVTGGNPASTSPYCLGGDKGPGFGWDAMTIVKLGYQWQWRPDWAWRVGVSHGEQPIPTDAGDNEILFNILAPGVIEDHVTFGFTKQIGTANELDFGFMYALEESIDDASPANANQNIELSMDQFWVSANWAWKF